jgi:hypothetical protein
MTEINTSVESFDNDISDDAIFSRSTVDNKNVDSRRRLEERLEQRYLEKDVREFDFDL